MLTVLMATYNGGETLAQVLDAYCKVESPDNGWKLLIVDNGSTDDTKEIITSFNQRLSLTYLFEPRSGKNAALNSGLSSVTGDLVVFTDDDVLPEPDWLRQICSSAARQPSFSIFGGPVVPRWERPPEEWILKWVPLGPTYTVLNVGAEGPISPRMVFGPNMAVRTDIFRRGYRFDETIGPNGSNYAMGSESELTRRLTKVGFKAWHCRHAVVYHIIRSSQMNKDWALGRAVRYGRGQYRLAVKEVPRIPVSVLGIPGGLILGILTQKLRVALARWSGDSEMVFKAHWHLNYLIGSALEARLMYRQRSMSAGRRRLWRAA